MSEKIDVLIQKVRIMELDHSPDGWPAIQMQDVSDLANAIENAIPSLNLLENHLKNGANISFNDNHCYLKNQKGEIISSGTSFRNMLVNLIFIEC